MQRRLLKAAAAVAAGAALALGPGTTAGHAQDVGIPVLLGDPDLGTYATVAAKEPQDDRYVRMLPLGTGSSQWAFRESPAGGTAIEHLDTGACLQPDTDGEEPYVRIGGCLRAAAESWLVESGETGTVFVHQDTRQCLTRPDADAADPLLTLAPCDDSERQVFSIVW